MEGFKPQIINPEEEPDMLTDVIAELEKRQETEYIELVPLLMGVKREPLIKKFLDDEINMVSISWRYFSTIEEVETIKNLNNLLSELLKTNQTEIDKRKGLAKQITDILKNN